MRVCEYVRKNYNSSHTTCEWCNKTLPSARDRAYVGIWDQNKTAALQHHHKGIMNKDRPNDRSIESAEGFEAPEHDVCYVIFGSDGIATSARSESAPPERESERQANCDMITKQELKFWSFCFRLTYTQTQRWDTKSGDYQKRIQHLLQNSAVLNMEQWLIILSAPRKVQLQQECPRDLNLSIKKVIMIGGAIEAWL